MLSNAFNIKMSSTAEQLDVSTLPEREQQTLCAGIRFDPKTHDCYRFFVMAEINMEEEQKKALFWLSRRRSFSRTDRVIIQSKPSRSGKIRFLGIFPTTATVDGQWGLDLEGEAILKPQMPGLGSLRVAGLLKHKIRKNKFSIYAGRTDALVQWVFLKPWIEAGGELKLQVLCSVEKTLWPSERHLVCDAQFSDGGRRLAALYGQKVSLPAT